MKYTVKELEAFSVIGQSTELTNYQTQNLQISTQFWRKFNANLKKAYLSQGGNWEKYAFMEKRDGKLFYFCAVPKKVIVPDGFILKEIPSCRYLVFQHIGSMTNIYETYNKIYKCILPGTEYALKKDDFLHFEKYDYRFRWNQDNSVIEIWVPILS